MKKNVILIIIFVLVLKDINAQTITSIYDSLGRITQITYSDSSIIKYAYDASGNRTSSIIQNGCANRTKPMITANSNLTFCQGDSVTLTSSSGNSYLWSNGNTTQSIVVKTAGIFSVTVNNGGICFLTSNPDTVKVNALPPIPTITAVGNNLQSSASSGNQWYLNGSLISGATSQQYTVQASGLYTVKVTVNGCTATSAAYNFVATATVDPSAWNYDVTLFPNPVNENLYITNRSNRKLAIRLIDITGKELLELNLSTANGTINMQKFAKGAYVVSITDLLKNETIHRLILRQ